MSWNRDGAALVFERDREPWELDVVETEGRFSIFEDGELVERSEWAPNAYANEGKTSALNVYYREQANPSKYLYAHTGAALTDASTMAALTEAAGAARPQMVAGSWSAPADPGDGSRQISHAEVSFGVAGAAWAITAIAGVTVAAGAAGLLLFYIAHTANVAIGQEFRFTIRQKARN